MLKKMTFVLAVSAAALWAVPNAQAADKATVAKVSGASDVASPTDVSAQRRRFIRRRLENS